MDKQGKIKIFAFVSLDGYVTKMGGDMDWLLEHRLPEGGDYGLGEFTKTVGCAVTNGLMSGLLQACDLWPQSDLKIHILAPDSSAVRATGMKSELLVLRPERGFGYVEAVDAIRRETAGDIWLAGDHDMLSIFMEHGLIDEITFNVLPITLGNGYAPFNRNRTEKGWRLEHCNCFDNDVVQVRWTVRR